MIVRNIPNEILKILKNSTFNKEDFNLFKDDYIKAVKKKYSKYNFEITEDIYFELSLFDKTTLFFTKKNDECSISFNYRKSVRIPDIALNNVAKKYNVNKIIHIAFVNIYSNIWMSDNGEFLIDNFNSECVKIKSTLFDLLIKLVKCESFEIHI